MPDSKAHLPIPVLSSGTAYKPGLDYHQLVIANAGRLGGK